jgi:RAB protein geranylgeranyltransferase component A
MKAKEKSKKSQDYKSLFIKDANITARLGKTVYIRKEHHERILKIVQVVGANEVFLFSYIDNIIAHHFETFQYDISQSYKNRISTDIFLKPFKIKLI